MHRPGPRATAVHTCATVICVVSLAAALVCGVWWAGTSSWAAIRAGTATFDDVMAFACACAAALVGGWAVIGVLGTAAARLPGVAGRFGRRFAARVVPVVVRHALPTVFGATVLATPVLTVATPSYAASQQAALSEAACHLPPIDRPAAASATLRSAEPSTFPDATTETSSDFPARVSGNRPESDYVEVEDGDTLWSIAADHLNPGARAAEVAEQWPRWFAANRDEIGDDPDLIHAGTVLAVPARS